MPDRVFCRRHDPDGHANWDSGFRPLLDDTCYMCAAEQLQQQLAAAHRAGWEQAKKQVEGIVNFYKPEDVGEAISVMEYKEPTNV